MIEIKNVSKWFGDFKVLSDINETVERGQTMVICGPSGSGKSTLLRCVNGLEPYEEGEIIVDGVSLSDPKTNLYKLRENIGMVFQRFELYPHMTVMQNISLKKKPQNFWSVSAFRRKRNPFRPISPAVNSNGWPSPAPWPWNPIT